MSIFFDKKIPAPASAGTRFYLDLKWHKSLALLAFIVDDDKKGGLVAIYDHFKEETNDIDTDTRSGVRVTCISWHPTEPFLAVGYDSGEVIVWNHTESESFESAKNHVGTIVVLGWSHCGSTLVSADSLGSLVVWSSNVEGHIQPKASHDFKDVVSQLVFRRPITVSSVNATEKTLGRVTAWRPKTARKDNSKLKSESESGSMNRNFFVGLLNGAIFYLKEGGTSEEVLTSGSSVKYLLYHQARDILIVMTDASILGQFQVDSNGGLSEINKVKISGRGDINLSWAGVGILAIVSEELSIRLIDVDSGDNFVLEPKGSVSYSTDEYICAIDYNEKTGHLCCNTNKGKLVIWKEVNPNESSQPISEDDDRWEWWCTCPVASTTRISRWCPVLPDILAINSIQDVFVLRQQDITATYKDKVSIIQTLATHLAVHLVDQKIKFDLQSDIQVKGFTNTSENICLWSGQQLEIYEFGKEIPKSYKFCGTFKEKSDTIYMFEKNIFVLESHQIQLKSFQGTIKQTLTFTSDEGPPITLSGAGEFITAATANGYIKIWHIGGREAKVHTPSKNLPTNIKNFGEIIQAKNNIEGSKIAFTIAKKNLVPDSRFYVWEIGSDTLVSMNFPGHFVSKICWEAVDPMYIALDLTVIPPELRVAKDEEDENLQATSQQPEITGIVLSTNNYLIKRAEKRTQQLKKQKNLDAFTTAPPPTLQELQQLVSDITNSRQKSRFQALGSMSTIPPWEIPTETTTSNKSNIDSTKYDLENESTTIKQSRRGKPLDENDIDEGYTESPKSAKKKSNLYKKPMLQSKPRFRVANPEDLGNQKSSATEKSDDLNLTTPIIPEKSKPSSTNTTKSLEEKVSENKIENPIEVTKKSSVINLKSKKKILDLAGFTRQSDGTFENFKSEEIPANQILTLFICSTEGILKHEKIIKQEATEVFLGLDVPHWYSLSKTKVKSDNSKSESSDQSYVSIERRAIADFKGVDEEATQDEKQKKQVKQALLNYVYHHLCGDVDKALMAMENIQSNEIWKNMARLCLTSKRVDVAGICFARMKNVGACRALRLSQQKEDDMDAQIAMVALQLDMLEDAERLYRECGRFDLLVDMLIACEQWEKAVEICENNYRIQLKTTCFLYAKYLEEEDMIEEAIQMYEKSGTYRYEVLRMLQSNPAKLEEYVLKKKDKDIFKWWAQYLESTGAMDSALSYYELAEDWYSLTRLLCFCDQVDKAKQVADGVKDKASCYHIAGVLHDTGKPEEAVNFYQRAGAYGPAMRICRETEMDEMLYNLSHLASSVDQLEAAKYFELRDPPEYEKAIRLYHKSGFSSKAMDIAFTTQQFSALQEVARELLESSTTKKDPEMLQRCAEFFVANKQFSKALDMYASAKKYAEAMDMCVKYKVPIDEEMAERLTAPKGEEGIDPTERSLLLEKMAECCMLQGSYHLAAKKFTQAGNKEKAMKVLLKSGDTERIIHYANVSRHRDIYLMAANYLQTTDWQKSQKIIDKIIIFYTKAKMPESIVSFYEAWAQSSYEVDKNYDQSMENLKKAEKVINELIGQESSGTSTMRSYELKLNKIQIKMKNVNTFLGLKELIRRNPSEALEHLKIFLKDPSLDGSLSRGDVYSLIIEYHVANEEYEAAVDMLVEMKQNISQKPGQFIKKEILETLNTALGKHGFRTSESNPGDRRGGGSFQFQELNPRESGDYYIGNGEDEEVEEVVEEIEDIEVEIDEDEEDVEYVEVEVDDEENRDEISSDFNQNHQLVQTERRGSLNIQQLLSKQSKRIK